jgi:hypothetical protein
MKVPKLKNPEFAISMSEGFYETGKSLAKHSKEDNTTGYIWIAPAVVNFSFATELILKGLLMIDSNVSTKGHKLLELYKKIKLSTRNQIEDIYRTKDPRVTKELPAYRIIIDFPNEEDPEKERATEKENTQPTTATNIEDILKIHSESFENWRYLYEFGEDGSRNEFDFKAMDNFYNALRDVLVEKMKGRPPRFGMTRM